MTFAIANSYVPIFNRPDFSYILGGIDGELLLDHQYLFRPLEMIAFKGSVFQIEKDLGNYVLEVTTDEYLVRQKLYIDKRFVDLSDKLPPKRLVSIPDKQKVLLKLLSCLNKPYLWGSNICEPLTILEKYYPSAGELSPFEHQVKYCDGLDCSGLLYYATDGYTPRNTSMLINFGKSIYASDKDQLIHQLKPLDCILTYDHISIVINQTTVIQSKEKLGCFLSPIQEVLEKISQKKTLVTDWDKQKYKKLYLIKRWYNCFN